MAADNPFAPPDEDEIPTLSSRIHTDGPLFSPGQIAGASFLGSPIAGVLLMVANHRRLGQHDRLPATLGIGGAIVAITFLFALVLPEWVPSIAVGASYTGAIYGWANSTFKETYDAYIATGGQRAGFLAIVGPTLLGLFAAVVAIVVLIVGWMALVGEL